MRRTIRPSTLLPARLPLLSLVLLGGLVYSLGGLDVFQTSVFRIDVGNDPIFVSAGDFNGDGRKDVVVANALSNNLSILLGSGNGSLGPESRIGVGMYPNSVAIGDFNGDAAQDLVVTNFQSNDVSLLLGMGNGTFSPESRLSGFSGPTFITTGDFNGDGRRDLAVTEQSLGDVVIMLGMGDGTFTGPVRFGTGLEPRSIAVGDFNADGIEDLVVANGHQDITGLTPPPPGTISILLGLGDGSFGPQAQYSAGALPYSVVVGDFNGDGRQDVAVSNRGNRAVSIFLGLGDGQFAPKTAIPTSNIFLGQIEVGDFNRDGRQDLAVADGYSNQVLLLVGAGDGTFVPDIPIGAGGGALSIALDDFTSDGIPDLAVVGPQANDLRIIPGLGDGHFGPRTRGATGDGPESIAAGDLNGDGLLDLAIANVDSDDVSVLLSRADGTLAPGARFAAGHYPVSIGIADLNADGRPDLVTANYGSKDVSVLLGLSKGGFGTPTAFPAGSVYNSPRSIATGDFNGDGRPDLAVANVGSLFIRRGFISVFLGVGDGTFAPQTTFAAGANPQFVAATDFNNDGRLDLAVVDPGPGDPFPSPDILVLLGRGDGTFDTPLATGSGSTPRSLAVADFNSDGRQDLAVARGDRTTPSDVSVLLGAGDGTFGPETHYVTTLGANSVVAADFDHDGRQDIAVANSVSNDIALFLGTGDGSFGPQTLLAAGAAPLSMAARDLNGDGAPDLAFANFNSNDVWIFLNRLVPFRIVDFTFSFSSPLGKGSGTLSWTTNQEIDLQGFNIIVLDNSGNPTQLNAVLIPCEECVTGIGDTYTYFLPKHKSGRNVFLEVVHTDGSRERFGPASKI